MKGAAVMKLRSTEEAWWIAPGICTAMRLDAVSDSSMRSDGETASVLFPSVRTASLDGVMVRRCGWKSESTPKRKVLRAVVSSAEARLGIHAEAQHAAAV